MFYGRASLTPVGFGRNGNHELEKSAMAAEQRVVKELQLKGVHEEQQPPINFEKILSSTTMKEWWSLIRASVGPELSKLHWGILSFCKAYELTTEEIQLQRDALACVERAVREIWPRAEVQLFGSRATDLALPWSDIDVTIMPPEQDLTFRNPTPIQWQNALSKKLNRLGQCRSLEKIPHARVPLLKIIFNSGIACDVSFDARNVQAGQALIRQFMKQYETLRPLCLVLKFFLGQNNLNELRSGGLSSFCISTMVVSHLQRMDSIIESERRDLGILLLSFFAHFSNMHNYTTDVVSTRADSRSSKVDKGWVNVKMPQLLAVEDPLNPTSDIGKGSYRMEEVRTKFSHAQRMLFTHWYNKHVLAQILDMTVNPKQRPAAEKSKVSKRGGRKRRRAASVQDDCILTHQAALQVERKLDHLQQGTGLVTSSQLDRNFNRGTQHFTSGLRSKRLRSGGFDEEEFHSVQLNLTPITPAIQGRDILRRTQSNAVDSNSLEANLSPTLKPRKISLRRQTSAEEDYHSVRTMQSQLSHEVPKVLEILVDPAQYSELSRACQDYSTGPESLEASDLTARKKSRKSLRHEAPKEDCGSVQSAAQSHLCHNDINADTRSRPRKISLKQREDPILLSESSRGQDSTGISDFLNTSNSTPVVEQAANSHNLQGVDSEGMRLYQDQRLLVHFWESHLTTPPKPSKGSLKYCGSGHNFGNTPGTPQKDSETWRKVQNKKPLEHCGTGGDIKHAQAVQTILPGELQNGSKVRPKSEGATLVEDSCTGGRREHTPAARPIQHRGSQDSSKHPEVQDEKLDKDFWEAQSTRQRKSRTSSLIHQNRGGAGGRDVQLNVAKPPAQGNDVVVGEVQGKRNVVDLPNAQGNDVVIGEVQGKRNVVDLPNAQGNDVVVGEVQGKRNVVDLPKPFFTKAWKSSSGSLPQGCEDQTDNQDQTILPEPLFTRQWKSSTGCLQHDSEDRTVKQDERMHHEQSPQGRDLDEATKGQDQEVLMGFWEAQLAPRPKSKKGALSDHDALGHAVHGSPRRPKSAKSPVLQDVTGGVNGVVLPVKVSDVDQPQNAKRITGRSGDEKLLADFWEAQLAPRLKGLECSAKPVAAGCEEKNAQSVWESHPDQPQNAKKITGRSGDEKLLADFWEAQLAPRLKGIECSSKSVASGCEEKNAQSVRESHPDQPQSERDFKGRSGDERLLLEFWEEQLAPTLKSSKYPSNLLAAECEEEDEQAARKSQLEQDERKLLEFWETHLNPNPRSTKGSFNDQQGADDEMEGGAEKGKDHAYDRILTDFWESHLTPSLVSRKQPPRQDGIECEEDVQPVEMTHQQLPTQQGSGLAGRNGGETRFSTFWEAYLNPAIPRKGYLRSNSTVVI